MIKLLMNKKKEEKRKRYPRQGINEWKYFIGLFVSSFFFNWLYNFVFFFGYFSYQNILKLSAYSDKKALKNR